MLSLADVELWNQNSICSHLDSGPVSLQEFDMEMAARVLWGSLGLLRLFWCLLPQTGYVHPDEFFQSPEVMAGKAPHVRLR